MTDKELEDITEKKIDNMTKSQNLEGNVIELTETNFDEVTSGEKPVIVDFWAEWCGPCQFMLPIFTKLAKIHHNHLRFARVDVDKSQSIAARNNVYAIPTFLVFQHGYEIDRVVGAIGETGLENLSQKHSIAK